MYLFGGIWVVALLMDALSANHGVGVKAMWVMACWLWIPLGMLSLRGWLAAPTQARMVLVLRVFRRDVQVQALFDDVVETWRYSGPTCLIAGTDLAFRRLEPDELFTFVSGRLQERRYEGGSLWPRCAIASWGGRRARTMADPRVPWTFVACPRVHPQDAVDVARLGRH